MNLGEYPVKMEFTGGVLITVLLAGFRHGFDIDHIAAIGDITSSQISRRRGFALANLYAAGHAVVLFALGLLAILAGSHIPQGLDEAMSRVIGATLVALGVYVVFSLVRYRRITTIKSRWMLVISGLRSSLAWLRRNRPVHIEHQHEHDHDALHGHDHMSEPPGIDAGGGRAPVAVATKTHSHVHTHVALNDPFDSYGAATSFGIGALHGVGAETPTQILLLTTAVGAAGTGAGVMLLLAFVAGLFLGNSVLAVVASYGVAQGRRMSLVFTVVAVIMAVLSLYVGTLYLVGRSDLLPGILGG